MIKNICSLLVTLVVSTSLIIISVVQPFTAHGETNKKEEIEIEYINKELGFSLTLPGSWRDKYNIKITDNSNVAFKVKLNKTYHSEIYDNIFLFTIHVYDESLKTEGGEGSLLGTNNGKSYWMTVDNALFHYDRYDEMFPDATEGDRRMITTMTEQVKDISKSFKMIGEKEATAEEMEPKEQGAKGQEAEEVTNHETANGIKYTNKKLGFELTLPKFWKDYYIVEENDRGGVTFKFKFNGKVYEDIYLFDIFVENREYSTEEQEMMGDVGILGIGNGKTYLITENLAMDYYNNYDEYFSSVPKDGQKMIETMSKQKKFLNFTILEAGVAKDNKALAKKANGTVSKSSTVEEAVAKEIIESELYQEDIGLYQKLYILKTPVENIKTEVIKNRLSGTNYTGINGGFLKLKYEEEKIKIFPRNISYFKGSEEGYDYNYIKSDQRSWSTFITYYDKKLQQTRAKVRDVKNMGEVKKHFKSHQEIINVIGGKGYKLAHWGNGNTFIKSLYYYATPSRKTALGFKEEGDKTYAYLIISKYDSTVRVMEGILKGLGFDENNSIMLDGSGSTSMQVYRNDKELLFQDKGSEPFINEVGNRYIYNTVRLIDTTNIKNNLEDKDK